MDQSPQVAAYQDNPLRRDKKRGQASFLGALMVAPRFLKVDSIPSATARRKGDIRNFAARGGPPRPRENVEYLGFFDVVRSKQGHHFAACAILWLAIQAAFAGPERLLFFGHGRFRPR